MVTSVLPTFVRRLLLQLPRPPEGSRQSEENSLYFTCTSIG